VSDITFGVAAIIVMGPTGAGKSTIGRALAREVGWRYLDADDLHTPEHVRQMQRGVPLSDAQRAPWMAAVAREIRASLCQHTPIVVSCSVLKRSYRDTLRAAARPAGSVRFVYLRVSRTELAGRVAARPGHFAPPSLVDTQLATLEEPGPDEEDVLQINGEEDVDVIVNTLKPGA
jgi:gluconokinase